MEYNLNYRGYLNRWMISELNQKRYIGSKLAFKRDESLIGIDAKKIIYPLRIEYLANENNMKHTYRKDNITELYVPFENTRVEYSSFWHECHELEFHAMTYLISQDAKKYNFELITCGSVSIWINGEQIHTFSPYTRNTPSKCMVELPLRAGKNEIVVSCRDLAERDTFNYFQLQYLGKEELKVDLPLEEDSKVFNYIEKYLQDSYFEKENYLSGDIKIIFSEKNKIEFKYSITFTDNVDLNPNTSNEAINIFKIGENTINLGKAENYPIGFNKIVITAYLKGVEISREFNVEVYPVECKPDTESSIESRKKKALEFAKLYGRNDIQKVFALIENNELSEKGKELLFSEIDGINRRKDCSDFRMPALIWLYKKYKELFNDEELEIIEETILNYRYWMDEPGNDVMWFFSENHALAFHTSEFLAGEIFEDSVFSNSGMKGFEHFSKAKELLERWFDKFEKYGYGEWNSAVYLPIDLISCFTLYEISEDQYIKNRAKKVLDRTFEIIARNNYKGIMTSSHGRVYEKELRGRRTAEASAISWVAWGEGYLNQHVYATVLFLVSSYKPAEHLKELAVYTPKEGIELRDVEGPENVNLYMYKSSDYSMATTLGYKEFQFGHQEHVFQMNIGDTPESQVWINHPGETKINGVGRPSYFAGNGVLPRVTQDKGTATLEFDISTEHEVDFTHAYCPLEFFDEYIEKDKWIFLKKLNGYMGIYAENGYKITDSGPLKNREIKSFGRKNRWVAKIGSQYEYKSFENFMNRIIENNK